MTRENKSRSKFLIYNALKEVIQFAVTFVVLYCILHYLVGAPLAFVLLFVVPSVTLFLVSIGARYTLLYRSECPELPNEETPSETERMSILGEFIQATPFNEGDRDLLREKLKGMLFTFIAYATHAYSVVCFAAKEPYPVAEAIMLVIGFVALWALVKPLSRVMITNPRFKRLLREMRRT
ncbi:MAG: hypothetical protein DRP45_09745 [Candidatus Zixiibacteriota bacterium]|nr:MAG: hypothetical protein DRP45_09745 [candidate division Zixibacteria bacterium]